MPDPYRATEEPSLTERMFHELWKSFKAYTVEHPRGLFLRAGDDGPRIRCVMAAVAGVVAPLTAEVSKLRKDVALLRKQVGR